MTTSRRVFLATSAASSALIGCPAILRAAGSEFTYKFGVDLPSAHPTAIWMQKAADRIKTETNGRLEIQVPTGSCVVGTELGSLPAISD